MFHCGEKGCQLIRSAGYAVALVYVDPLSIAGHYCTYCHGFWPTLDAGQIDPLVGGNLRHYLAAAGLDPDENDHKVRFIDREYLRWREEDRRMIKAKRLANIEKAREASKKNKAIEKLHSDE